MNFIILGIQPRKFTNKDNGEVVELITLHLGYESDNVSGYICDKVNLTVKKYNEFGTFKVGQQINVYYNKYGKVELINHVK